MDYLLSSPHETISEVVSCGSLLMPPSAVNIKPTSSGQLQAWPLSPLTASPYPVGVPNLSFSECFQPFQGCSVQQAKCQSAPKTKGGGGSRR